MTREYTRASRTAPAEEMPAEFRTALERHAALVGIEGHPLAGARATAVTESAPLKRGLLRRSRDYTTWIVVTPAHLVVVSDASGSPVASIYRRDDLEARPFSSPLIEDDGLDVVAMPVGGSERSSVFLPLAAGPARDAVLAALTGSATP